MRVRPYITEDNKIDGAVLSFIDVNVLKQHENELRVEEKKYRTLAENSPDIIARFDRNLRYLYVNSAIEKLTGISSKTFVGKAIHEMGLPKISPKHGLKFSKMSSELVRKKKAKLNFKVQQGLEFTSMLSFPNFLLTGTVETVFMIDVH